MWPNDFFLAKKWTMNALSTNASMAYKQPTQEGTTITTQLHTFITHSFSSLDHSTLIYTHTESNIWSGSISAIYIETFSQRFFHHHRIWFEQVKNEWMNKNARETSGSKRLHLKRCKERLRVRDTHTRTLQSESITHFLTECIHEWTCSCQNPPAKSTFIQIHFNDHKNKYTKAEDFGAHSVNKYKYIWFYFNWTVSPLMPHHQQQEQVLHRQSLENESFYFWRRKKTAADQNKTLNRFFTGTIRNFFSLTFPKLL